MDSAGLSNSKGSVFDQSSKQSSVSISVSNDQVDLLQEEVNKYAPQVDDGTVKLNKQLGGPASTMESNGDASMNSNSLCNKIAESSLNNGTMSFEDMVQLDKTICKVRASTASNKPFPRAFMMSIIPVLYNIKFEISFHQ